MHICAGAPTRPPARAAEPARAQPRPPRADRGPRLLLPTLGVEARRAPASFDPLYPLAMRPRRGTICCACALDVRLSMSCKSYIRIATPIMVR